MARYVAEMRLPKSRAGWGFSALGLAFAVVGIVELIHAWASDHSSLSPALTLTTGIPFLVAGYGMKPMSIVEPSWRTPRKNDSEDDGSSV